MARLKHYTHSLASGYLLLGANIAYSLAMIPLALSYLDKSVFGIWAVVVQIGVFLQLTDLGMTGAFVRILIEYKDHPDRNEYASVIKTMGIVFCLQGLVVMLSGWFGSPIIGDAFKIEPEHQALFVGFLRTYLLIFVFEIALKVFSLTLSAHQRNDLVNFAAIIGFGVNYLGLWLAFRWGWGLWAMALGYGLRTLINNALYVWQAIRTKLLPAGFLYARFSRAKFLEVFDYGKDRFLVTAGNSLLRSAPAFLIARFLGLAANAEWTVGTRLFYLCFQLVGRVSDLAYPALAEMYVRREMVRLKERFVLLMELSAMASGILAVLLAFVNSEFVTVWTHGKIAWDSRLDPLLGVWLIMVILRKVAWLPVGACKTLGFMRFADSLELVVMIVMVTYFLSWIRSPLGVILGLLTASLVGAGPYCVYRSGQILNTPAFSLLRPPVVTLLICVIPLTAVACGMTRVTWPGGFFGLTIKGSLFGFFAVALVLARPKFRRLGWEIFHNLSVRA